MVSVVDYGADPTGITDSTNAFISALTDPLLVQGTSTPLTLPAAPIPPPPIRVYVPAGTYIVNKTLNITKSGTTLFGDGPETSIIIMVDPPNASPTNNNAATPVIVVYSGLNFVTIHDLSIRRITPTPNPSPPPTYITPPTLFSYPAQPNGNGIDVSGTPQVINCYIYNILCDGHYYGFLLGSVQDGIVQNCIAQNCQTAWILSEQLRP